MNSNRPPLPSLTGVRFFAALAIVINHLGPNLSRVGYDLQVIIDRFHQFAYLGMTLFFVLSGFIIHYNYGHTIANWRAPEIWKYGIARITRLYPLFFLLVVFDLVSNNFFLNATVAEMQAFAAMLPYVLSGVQSWWYFVQDGFFVPAPYRWSVVTWSISTEFALYIAYLFVAPWLSRIRRRVVIVPATVAVVGSAAVICFLLKDNSAMISDFASRRLGIVSHQVSPFGEWLWYLSPFGRLPEFMTGCFLAQVVLAVRDTPPDARENATGGVILSSCIFGLMLHIGLYFSGFLPVDASIYFLIRLPIVAVAILCLARHKNFGTRLFAFPKIVALGEASYSIYLLHLIVVYLVAMPVELELTELRFLVLIFRSLMAIGFVLLLSLGVHRYLEMPAQNALRRALLPPKRSPSQLA